MLAIELSVSLKIRRRLPLRITNAAEALSQLRIARAKRVEVSRGMADGTCEVEKISALKPYFVSSTRSPMLIVNQQGTGIICRKIFFATSKLIECDQIVECDQFSVANDLRISSHLRNMCSGDS